MTSPDPFQPKSNSAAAPGRSPTSPPIDHGTTSTVKAGFYTSSRLEIRGRGPKEPLLLCAANSIRGYAWNSTTAEWTGVSLLLGIAKPEKAGPQHRLQVVSPIADDTLEKIFQATLLNNCSGRPDKLLQILAKAEIDLKDDENLTVSLPIPLYHRSGQYKDVYFLNILILDNNHRTLNEVKLAVKIGKFAKSISDTEITYHSKLSDSRAPGQSECISRYLGAFELSDYPELQMPGQRITIELFVPGHTAEHYLHHGGHLGAATAVSKCALRMYTNAVGTLGGTSSLLEPNSDKPSLLRAAFPIDINPGNFNILPNSLAVHLDPGEVQAMHTFPEFLLRLIRTYWYFSSTSNKLTPFNGMLPLADLFEAVTEHYGESNGNRLLRETAIALEFMIGTPIDKIKARHNREGRIDAIGTKLAAIYSELDDGSKVYIDKAIKLKRDSFNALTLAVGRDTPRDDPGRKLFEDPRSLPYFYSDRELRSVLTELRLFLGTKETSKRSRRQRSFTFFRRRANLPNWERSRSLPRRLNSFNPSPSRFDDYHVDAAVFITPFHDTGALRMAFLTAHLRPRAGGGDRTEIGDRADYCARLVSIAATLRDFFDSDSHCQTIADILDGPLAFAFRKVGKQNYKDETSFRNLVEAWVLLAVQINSVLFFTENRDLKGPEKLTAPDFLNDLLQKITTSDADSIFDKISRVFKAHSIPGAIYNLAQVKAGLEGAVNQITALLRTRSAPEIRIQIPKLIYSPPKSG